MATYRAANVCDPDSHFVAKHIGMTVKTYTVEERVMSDVYAPVTYAVCYIPEKDTFEHVRVVAHFECDGRGYAEVDATDEVLAKWEAYQAAEAEKRAEAEKAARLARYIAEAKRVAKGRTVTVVRGRKVPVGITGTCFWLGESRYGTRCGIKVDGQTDPVWVDARNVEAVFDEQAIRAEISA